MSIINDKFKGFVSHNHKIRLAINPTQNIKYGRLYNLPAIKDPRNISSAGWTVPTVAQGLALELTYAGGEYARGNALASNSDGSWNDSTGATNISGFSAIGSGFRADTVFSGTSFDQMKGTSFYCHLLNTDYPTDIAFLQVYNPNYDLLNMSADITISNSGIWEKYGLSVRLINATSTLSNGQTGMYIGNDGQKYKTIVIGGVEWMTENLAETKYRDGSLIPEVIEISNWLTLTTGAMCSYDNNIENVYSNSSAGEIILKDKGAIKTANGISISQDGDVVKICTVPSELVITKPNIESVFTGIITTHTHPDDKVSIKNNGAVGDGIKDDTICIKSALTYAMLNGLKVVWESGTYNISGNITSQDTQTYKCLHIEFGANVKINVVGSGLFTYPNQKQLFSICTITSHSLLLTGGNVEINGGNIASRAIVTSNITTPNGGFLIDCASLKISNLYTSATDTIGTNAIYTYGDYRSLVIRNLMVDSVDRADAVNATQTTQAILIASFYGSCLIDNTIVQNIGHSTLTQDCDAIVLRGHNQLAHEKVLGDCTVQNSYFRNSRGRFIKSQISNVKIVNCEFWQSNIAFMPNGLAVDFQYGFGSVTNCKFYFPLNAGTPTVANTGCVIAFQGNTTDDTQISVCSGNQFVLGSPVGNIAVLISTNTVGSSSVLYFDNNNVSVLYPTVTNAVFRAVVEFRADQLITLPSTSIWRIYMRNNVVATTGKLLAYTGYDGATDLSAKLAFYLIDNANTLSGDIIFGNMSGFRIPYVIDYRIFSNSNFVDTLRGWKVDFTTNATQGKNEFMVDLSETTFVNAPAGIPSTGYARIGFGTKNTTYGLQFRSIDVANFSFSKKIQTTIWI